MRMGVANFNHMSFGGTTTVYAVTDPHQETRKECALLSQIAKEAEKNKNVLVLFGGDLFKGVYSRELEVESWLELKRSSPNLEIIMTLGNNDFGFNQEDFQYLQDTLKKFDENRIHVVCANIFENSTDKRPDWAKPYKIVERGGDRLFVTGFCIARSDVDKYGVNLKDSKEVLDGLKQSMLEEKPDSIIILNHDEYVKSEELVRFAKEHGIKI